jgi:hypothetical protein
MGPGRGDGKAAALSDFGGWAPRVVNDASKHGFAPQYAGPEGVKHDFPSRFSKSMVRCLLPIRSGRRSMKCPEAGMVDLTVAAPKRRLNAGRKPRTTKARRAGPEREKGGEQKKAIF